VRFERADGELRWIAVRSSPHTTEDGTLIYQGYLEDITAQKVAEERMRRSESFLQQIFDTTNAGIFLVNAQGVITFANDKMTRMFACSMQQLVQAPYTSLINPAERESGHRKMLALLASSIDSVNLERLYLRKD